MAKFSEKFPYLFYIKTLAQKSKEAGDFYLKTSEINTSLGMLLGQINCSQENNQNINRKHLEYALKITGPSVSNLLNKLEAINTITRNNNKKDNRNLTINITDKGRTLLNETNTALKKTDELLTLGMSEEEKILFLKLLEHSLNNLEKLSKVYED